MEEKKRQSHAISLADRHTGMISGVLDVISFDDKIISLNTQGGKLTIKGSQLLICSLSLEKGEVEIQGTVDTLVYSDRAKPGGEKKESLFERMFQ